MEMGGEISKIGNWGPITVRCKRVRYGELQEREKCLPSYMVKLTLRSR